MASDVDPVDLRAAWTTAVGRSAESHAAFDELLDRHREAHRRYHSVRHVMWVVGHVNELAAWQPVGDLHAVIVAAFFHDAVYDPTRSDNEERSAGLAERVLGDLGWPEERRRTVGQLVRATQHHAPTADTGTDADVLVDADLAVLGTEPATYAQYAAAVRAEYRHVDDDAWRHGRAAVLRGLLERTSLFATATGRDRWEMRARANLTAELADLSGSAGRDEAGPGRRA